MVMPVDTSEGERVFSLMNNIKTSERSRLNDENVRNLMLWYVAAKDIPPENIPCMAILQNFRELAGPRGRHCHKETVPVSVNNM